MLSKTCAGLACIVFLMGAPQAQAGVTRVEASKEAGTLTFYDHEKVVATFRSVFGSNPAPKAREGDRATPIGRYMLHPARASRSWNWFMPIDYPNADDKKAGRTGRDVGLHGTGWNPLVGFAHWLRFNWTAGCIAVSNSEIEQIRHLVKEPVPLEINP